MATVWSSRRRTQSLVRGRAVEYASPVLRARSHGGPGPKVVVLHGGPGAPGSAAGLAAGLADGFTVLEPFQRGAGDEPRTVARHVADLAELLAAWAPEGCALVGASWGAMLALIFAAERPDAARAVAMVGSGTFDAASRARFKATLAARTTPELQRRSAELDAAPLSDDARLARKAALLEALYQCEPQPEPEAREPVDARANRETWADMLARIADGTYPAAFTRVRCPVRMFHGDFDPHPGPAIRDSLAPHVRDLTYDELPRCGHEPWREPGARADFFARLRAWLRAATPQP